MSRLTTPDSAAYTPEQRRVAEAIAAGPRGSVRGPLAVWLRRPGLAEPAQALGAYCRYGSALSPALSELAILVTARVWGSEYEWAAHKTHGLAAGLDPALIEAIRTHATPAFADPEQAIVYEVATILNRTRTLDDALYARAVGLLGEDRMVDLVGVLGYYTLVSMTLNVFAVDRTDGKQELADVSSSG